MLSLWQEEERGSSEEDISDDEDDEEDEEEEDESPTARRRPKKKSKPFVAPPPRALPQRTTRGARMGNAVAEEGDEEFWVRAGARACPASSANRMPHTRRSSAARPNLWPPLPSSCRTKSFSRRRRTMSGTKRRASRRTDLTSTLTNRCVAATLACS